MPPSYPSPTAAQVGSGAGPFYSQAGAEPTQLPHDLHQLQDADVARPQQPHLGPHAQAGVAYSPQSQPHAHQPDLQVQHHPDLLDPNSDRAAQERLAQGVLSMSSDPAQQQQQQHTPHAPQGMPLNAYVEDTPDSATRKRSKVSRACDECRRKKIRCDATLEQPDDPCSNCKRTRTICQFSRQPMKRGPSKGYIKELADRLNRLENDFGHGQIPPHHLAPGDAQYLQAFGDDGLTQRLGEGPEYSPPLGPAGRKRTHSVSDGQYGRDGDPYMSAAQRQQIPWTEPGRSLPLPSQPPSSQAPLPTQVGIPDLSVLRQPSSPPPSSATWRYSSQSNGQRDAVGVPYDSSLDDADAAALVEWDESIVDEYYRLIHQTFPLLPHSKMRLRARLASSSSSLREAFLLTLELLIRTSPSTVLPGLPDASKNTKRAAELISASQFAAISTRTLSTDIIYIQSLILMALASDNFGPATMRGQVGPPRAEWLGRAIGMATHLKLNTARSRDRIGEGDPDADEKLGRRVWWILFILDRWHSSSTNSLLQLPDNSSALIAEDQIMLGESTYHLARLSYILGHLSTILQGPADLMSRSNVAAPIITLTILGEIDRFRESVESQLMGPPNLVHLSYWHVRLLVLRLTSNTAPHELLAPATKMASILNSMHTTITPLNHHFAALAAMTLVELSEFDETRTAAETAIRDIVEALGARRGLMSREDSTGWDSAIRELVVRKRGARTGDDAPPGSGLLHLADAATGGDRKAWDPSNTTRTGYLAALVNDFGAAGGSVNPGSSQGLSSGTLVATSTATGPQGQGNASLNDANEDMTSGLEALGSRGKMSTSSTAAPAPTRKRRRPAVVCTECRRRKIACDRNAPCGQCVLVNSTCTYSSPNYEPTARPRPASAVKTNATSQPSDRDTSASATRDTAAFDIVSLPSVFGPGFRETREPSRGGELRRSVQERPQSPINYLHIGRFQKARFFGPTHWMNNIAQFEELGRSAGINEIFERDSELYALLDKCKRLARKLKAKPEIGRPTATELQDYFPPRQACQRLVDLYLNTFERVFRVLHIPTFQREFNEHWNNPHNGNTSFIVKLLLILAIGACFDKDSSQDGSSFHEFSSLWIYAAEVWLKTSMGKQNLNLGGIQAHCLVLIARQTSTTGGDLTWISAGLLVRQAVSVGLHRDPSNFPNMSVLEAELRRRLWATTVELLVQSSLDSGLPPMISSEDFDCRSPANIDDDEVSVSTESPPMDKTLDRHTQTSMQCALLKSLPLRLMVAKALNSIRSDLSYDKTLKLSEQVMNACRSNSDLFKSQLSKPQSPEQEQAITFQVNLLDLLVRRFVLALHTAFAHKAVENVSYYFSRKVCLESSFLLLADSAASLPRERELRDEYCTRIGLYGCGLFKSVFLHAASTIFMELVFSLKEDSSPPALSLSRSELLRTVTDLVDVTRRRVGADETSVKPYVFFTCALAEIQAMQAGSSIERATSSAAKASLEACIETLDARARRNGVIPPANDPEQHGVNGSVLANEPIVNSFSDHSLSLGIIAPDDWLFPDWLDVNSWL
ncbi:hypothetical protein FH972_022961 [Carpinus fangiana]|uniref:Zn(2)-C6 fungal-type domain-containing protein n=1 Tax=Carpinus fangiana TaxID=176857 RepID=A0A5N6KTS2_9ROSI|nr:hypothetical protein FH972_022961 [Carpinus fangiana]